MYEGPSRIALLMAAARAYTSHEFDPVVRNPDWIADALLSPDEIALLDNHPMGRALNQDYRIAALDPEVSGLARPALVLTRYIDEKVLGALDDGIRQFAIIRAGFDTRAYRFRPRFADSKVVEIDDEPTQALKRQRTELVLGPPPSFLSHATLADELFATLNEEPTLFLWESASMHATASAARTLLQQISSFPRGTRLAMDYVPSAQVERVNKDPMSPQSRWDRSWNEPWTLGLTPDFFAAFTPSDQLDTASSEAAKRYLTRREGSTFGPPPNAPGTGFEQDHRRLLVTLAL